MNTTVEEKQGAVDSASMGSELAAMTTPASKAPKSKKQVSKTMVNFWLDSALLVVFCGLLWVSCVIRFVFPPVVDSIGWTLWTADLDQWISIQFGLFCLLTLGILVHLMLHWTWVCGVLSNRLLPLKDGKKRSFDDGTRTIIGVGLMILLLNVMGLGMVVAVLSVNNPF